jgi:hypothetical protein
MAPPPPFIGAHALVRHSSTLIRYHFASTRTPFPPHGLAADNPTGVDHEHRFRARRRTNPRRIGRCLCQPGSQKAQALGSTRLCGESRPAYALLGLAQGDGHTADRVRREF